MKAACMLTIAVLASVVIGCNGTPGLPGAGSGTGDDPKADAVAEKAAQVADEIGGTNGFGGTLMDGYMQHMPYHMGFNSVADLADPDGHVTVELWNGTDQACTFHLSYYDSNEDSPEQSEDVQVDAGSETTIQIPCSEILGVGPLEDPGETGCLLADGTQVSNVMAVPGFLGTDYTCGSMYEFMLQPDVDDLNGNGDTEELIITSDAILAHMGPGGMMGHMHDDDDDGFGMMGQTP